MTAAIVDHRRRGGRSKPYLYPLLPSVLETEKHCYAVVWFLLKSIVQPFVNWQNTRDHCSLFRVPTPQQKIKSILKPGGHYLYLSRPLNINRKVLHGRVWKLDVRRVPEGIVYE